MFGITLATGLVVDDAIVVIENIERHIQEGERDSHKAASVAMGEVAGAVIATSLVLVAVFVPVAFFPGTTGILFRQFALTIAFSIAISAFNALTLTPALSAILLGREHGRKELVLPAAWTKSSTASPRDTGGPCVLFLRFRLIAGGAVLRRPGPDLPGLPARAQGLRAQRRPGIFHHRGAGAVGRVARIHAGASASRFRHVCQDIPEVQGIFAIAGFSFSGSASNQALIFVPLKPYSQRKGDEHAAEARS